MEIEIYYMKYAKQHAKIMFIHAEKIPSIVLVLK